MFTFRRMAAVASAAAVAAVVVALTAAPAGAVIDGTDDTANQYQNVGALQLRIDGEWFTFCSGTLVEQDVVLTAAHCTDFFTAAVGEEGLGPDDLRVTFDVVADEDATYYGAETVVVNPDWLTAPPGKGNSKHLFLASPAEDIALIFLESDVSGVTPAPVAEPGYLDGLDLTSEIFTVVGYGTDEFVTGSFFAPNAITLFDGVRSYRDVTVITTHDAFPDRFLKITAGVCFGDSGGPLFHGDTLVALNTWTFSARCAGPNLEYRVDSAQAQEFLDTYL
jgi:V8-like Glu-specific endopeptidase